MIDLRAHAAGEHGLSVSHRQLIRPILSVDGQRQLVVRQLLGRTRGGYKQHASDNRGLDAAEHSTNLFRPGVGPFCSQVLHDEANTIPTQGWTLNI
jgi:hypothetical protein